MPVPKAYCLCEDDAVIGTPFYIMEFLDGRMFTDPSMPGLSAEERNALYVVFLRKASKQKNQKRWLTEDAGGRMQCPH